MGRDSVTIRDGGLADNLHVAHCLIQLRNIALQKKELKVFAFTEVSVKNVLL